MINNIEYIFNIIEKSKLMDTLKIIVLAKYLWNKYSIIFLKSKF